MRGREHTTAILVLITVGYENAGCFCHTATFFGETSLL